MKVSNSQVQQVLGQYARQVQRPKGAGEAKPPGLGQDQVELSPEAREIKAAQQALAQTPEVRTDKVEEIKGRIASGTYEVRGEEVAEKIIARSIVDRLA